MTRNDIVAHIDRWESDGLLDHDQAQGLRADIAGRGTPQVEGDPGVSRSFVETAVTAGLEALGYLGAALVLGAATFLFDLPNWPRPAIALLLAIATATCAFLVRRVAPAEPGPASRLVTIVGTAGLFSLAGFLALVLDPTCSGDCGYLQERVFPLGIAVVTTAAAVVLYRTERNAVTHLWIGVGTATVLWMTTLLFFPDPIRSYRAQERAASLLLLPAAWAWVWASETKRLTPAWIGTIGASGVALTSIVNLADFDLFSSDNGAVALALLVFGGTYVATGVNLNRWRLTTIGSLVLVWAVPWTLAEVFGLSETTIAVLLLPLGVMMILYVVRRLMTPASDHETERAPTAAAADQAGE